MGTNVESPMDDMAKKIKQYLVKQQKMKKLWIMKRF